MPHLCGWLPREGAQAKGHIVPDKILGNTEPRLYPAPLRDLDEPGSTLGPDVIAMAARVGKPLLPWQRWWAVHALELSLNGELRFDTVLTRTGRQNGRTELFRIVALVMMFGGASRRVYGLGHSRETAKESLWRLVDLMHRDHDLSSRVARTSRTNGAESVLLANGARYEIGSARPRPGHRLTVVDLLLLDDGLLEHLTWDEWAALALVTSDSISPLTLGSYNSDPKKDSVLEAFRVGDGVADFDWSAPPGTPLDDRDGWAAANPALGYTMPEFLLRRALDNTGDTTFRYEHM